MIRPLRHVAVGLAASGLLCVLLIGIPAALIILVGWPLPTSLPELEQIRQAAQLGIAEQTVVNILTVIIWAAWAQLAIAIVVEAVALIRRTAARTLPLLPGLQPLAARLIATVALIAATATPRGAFAITPLDVALATPPATATTLDLQPAPTSPQADHKPAPAVTITTGERDTWWKLAETHLGDGLRWREIRDLNLDRHVADGAVISTGTDQLEDGWTLLVPATDNEPTSDNDVDETPSGEWQVQPGDHFWHIAEHTLTQAWGRPPTDAEIAAYWRLLVDANRDRLLPPGDPDLIYPDQQLATPPPPVDPTVQSAPEQPAPQPQPETSPPHDTHTDVPGEGDGWQSAIEDRDSPVTSGEPTGSDVDGDPRTVLGTPAGLTASVAATGLLAAGVVAMLRWRRRAALQQRAPGLRLPTLLPEADIQTARLETAAVPEKSLDDLTSLLASIPPDVDPAIVTVTDDATVTLLFDEQADLPDPPAPWTLADDGTQGPVGWSAAIGDTGPERSVGLPLLVTLGRTGTATVLANITALPTLSVDGPQSEVRRRLRAMSLEAATSRIAIPVEVAIAGDNRLAGIDHIRHTHDLTGEIGLALAELEHDVVYDDRTPRLLVCHPDTTPPDVPNELTGMVGVIAVAPVADATWTLELSDGQTGRLRLPDGGTVQLALPDIDPDLVDDELTRLDQYPTGHLPDPTIDIGRAVEPSTNGHAPPAGRSATEPAWCEVRLLGPVEVVRDGVRTDGLTPRIRELLAYLATHRDTATKERVDDAIWAGRAPRPGSQRVTTAVTKLRNLLGDGPDGTPLLPRRTGTEPIRLSEHVGCDLDRALAHLAIARDLPDQLRTRELDAALTLVRGEPFHDLPVSWASEIAQRAIAQLQDAALDAARAHRQAGDYDAAETAIHQGLLLLDPVGALYLERAQIEQERGRPEHVARIWDQYRSALADDADEIAGAVSTPPPEIELAFRELLSVS